jgi:hypothetical protein
MNTSENLQQCPAGGFFVLGRQGRAVSEPNRSRGAKAGDKARDRRVGPADF